MDNRFANYVASEKVGTGIWFMLHWQALHLTSSSDEKYFIKMLYNLADDFPCQKCRQHFQEYLVHSPPEKSSNPFRWVWKFHNKVNHRLHKVTMSYEEVETFFRELKDKPCTKCAGNNEEGNKFYPQHKKKKSPAVYFVDDNDPIHLMPRHRSSIRY